MPGNQQWVPTGFVVRRGETIRFNANGEVMWTHRAGRSRDAGRRAEPAECPERPPVGNAPGGALIGRVGNGTAVPDRQSGLGEDAGEWRVVPRHQRRRAGDNTGNFFVTISR